MPGIRHNGGIDWDILILQLIYKKTLKDKTPGETFVSFSLPGTLVIDLCHMISLSQWCLMKISSDLKTTSLADLQKWLTTGIPWIWRMNLFIKVITCYNHWNDHLIFYHHTSFPNHRLRNKGVVCVEQHVDLPRCLLFIPGPVDLSERH